VRETVAMRLASIKITDITGDLQVKRAGKARKERVDGPIVVSEGDLLLAERGTVTFLLDDYPVALTPQTHVGVAYEMETSAPAIVIERGEALVDCSAAAAPWYVASRNVSVRINQTQGRFAVGAETQGRLRLTALSGHLTGKDDYGRPFDLRAGEKLVAGSDTSTIAPAPDAAKKAAMLAAAVPSTQTFYSTTFDRGSMAGVSIVDGVLDKQGEWLVATERKGTLSATMKIPTEIFYNHALVVRMRVRTNLAETRLVLQVGEKALLFVEHKTSRDQRFAWRTAEFALTDVKGVGLGQAGYSINGQDRIVQVGATGEKKTVFGDERPYLQIDDVQMARKP
jgi:hypothetical protein